jgi:hypothetical protein
MRQRDAQDLLTDITGHENYEKFGYVASLSGNNLVFTAKSNGPVDLLQQAHVWRLNCLRRRVPELPTRRGRGILRRVR